MACQDSVQEGARGPGGEHATVNTQAVRLGTARTATHGSARKAKSSGQRKVAAASEVVGDAGEGAARHVRVRRGGHGGGGGRGREQRESTGLEGGTGGRGAETRMGWRQAGEKWRRSIEMCWVDKIGNEVDKNECRSPEVSFMSWTWIKSDGAAPCALRKTTECPRTK